MTFSNADRVESLRKFLDANGMKSVGIDPRFPLGNIECCTLYRIKSTCSALTLDIPFYVTLAEVMKLEARGGKGFVYGRTEWGPYCKLVCEYYRIRYVIRLSDDEQRAVQKSIYEEV